MARETQLENDEVLTSEKSIMKAVRIHKYGKSSVLKYEEVKIPGIRPDEVLVKVHSSGVNPIDWKIREGYMKDTMPRTLPFIPGWDVSGTVEETGILVSGFRKGDAVFARPDFSEDGTYAEYVALKGFELAVAPTSIPLEHAAGIPLSAQTAWMGLFEYGRVEKDLSVLIHGAAGGVGSFAVQLAKIAGAYVIAATSSGNIEVVRSLGADVVINYDAEDFEKRIDKVDRVFDTIGGEIQKRSYKVLHRGGILVSTVGVDEKEAAMHQVDAKSYLIVSNGSRLAEIANLINQGMLRVIIDSEYPFSKAADAQNRSQSGKAVGKIILRVQ
jgi:NADPH:quinone reductase-like Zn-dependent oxidoreductase